ncbi:MAG TPA: aminotransferase class I/II-fold pyridoxal phosphate-dependent enzyme, partial [Paracoccus sp. (in: a-proteobacteria)]|nr:aminotransferase class I/II-fold pyridoxal phosphate-dependent enzyme [Paracoccus sp. (in: a-proteobacteria)]
GPELLDYPGPTADLACRQALLGWLADRLLGDITADDLALSMGGQGAMGVVMQLVLRDHRPLILAEALGYPGLRHAARLARGRMVPVALDERGMIPAALDAAAADGLAGLVCVTPAAQNPTAASMDRPRREEIVVVARRHDLQILEDECIWSPSYPDQLSSLRALAPERTWTVTSLSKTLSAALRVGALVCPAGMGQPARLAVQHAHFGLPLPVTAMVTHLLDSGIAARLGAEVQAIFDDRAASAAAALDGTDVVWRPGAPHLWLRLPPGWRGSTFVRAACWSGPLTNSRRCTAMAGRRGRGRRCPTPSGWPSPARSRARALTAPSQPCAACMTRRRPK